MSLISPSNAKVLFITFETRMYILIKGNWRGIFETCEKKIKNTKVDCAKIYFYVYQFS